MIDGPIVGDAISESEWMEGQQGTLGDNLCFKDCLVYQSDTPLGWS